MVKKEFIIKHFTKITFLAAGIFFVASISVFAFTKTPLLKKITSEVIVKHVILTSTPTLRQAGSLDSSIQVTIVITPTTTQAQSHPTTNPTPTSGPTQAPQAQQSTINMQISEPDGTVNFSLPVGGNACDELTEAKQEGKIRSVTFNDRYMSNMHSLYVTEINSYQNNWTFTVNGQGPAGCSLASPKAGDNVVWKF